MRAWTAAMCVSPMAPDCVCGHPYLAHHGPGPCLAVVSTATKQTKALEGKVSAGSICPCQSYAPKP